MNSSEQHEERQIDFSPVLAAADAVLFEGYLLYPYRRSSSKNRLRWQFGVLAPRAWIEASRPPDDGVAGSAESWWNQTECLLEASPDATLEVRLRGLTPARCGAGAGAVDGFDRADAQEVGCVVRLRDLTEGREITVPLSPGSQSVRAQMTLRAGRAPAPWPLHQLTIRVENTTGGVAADVARSEALRHSLVSTHVLLGVDAGAFLSLLDPPAWAATAAARCRNIRLFPVLADPAGSARFVLSAPIILPDHPQVAPESPGDLFDATEIDEILSLRTLTLTDAEKAEARATDPRASDILDRVDSMPPEMLSRLHGAVRSLRPLRAAPEADTVMVDGAEMGAGARVRLRPRRRGTDAQDMFLAGRLATVTSVLTDVDGRRYVGVAVDDDPRTTLAGGPGQVRHFAPSEVEPLPPSEGGPG